MKAKTAAHGETKTQSLKLVLTPTAKNALIERAAQMGIKPSELVERFARNLVSPTEEGQFLGEQSNCS